MNNKKTYEEQVVELEMKKVVIEEFLKYVNKKSDKFILKGGTGLMECYGLGRISDDIDMNSEKQTNFFEIVKEFCEKNKYEWREAKNTKTVQRAMIHFPQCENNPLKIEISYRDPHIDKDDITRINGIRVYKLDEIAKMKAEAYQSRDKIRDMYDLCFIINEKGDELGKDAKKSIRRALMNKGLEQYDYICNDKDQNAIMIDKEKLGKDLLDAFENLDLLDEPRKKINNIEKEMKIR